MMAHAAAADAATANCKASPAPDVWGGDGSGGAVTDEDLQRGLWTPPQDDPGHALSGERSGDTEHAPRR